MYRRRGSTSGADRPAEPTKREARRTALAERIRYFFDLSGKTYGSPRITLDLWEEGWQVSQNTVAEIMAELGLQGRKPPRRRRSVTRPGKRNAAPDLVRRKFDAIALELLWWGDMTEIDTGEGTLYLASGHDAFSRRALGYAMGERHDTALISAALQMAIATRRRPGRRRHLPHGPRQRNTPPRRSSSSAAAGAWCSRWGESGRRWTTPPRSRSTRSSSSRRGSRTSTTRSGVTARLAESARRVRTDHPGSASPDRSGRPGRITNVSTKTGD
ncbi:IS3 family transposase [Streptomyces sp. NRRL B-3229]|uniref:IS3 family transposase n=1 Tax=Streptomyces sp. NRRL B-3229 TaxID=1463836 RepID=UPI0018FE806C